MLLHTAERPKRSFSCFCTLQKDQKGVFHASAHCKKVKKSFSCFCTLQKGQKEFFMLLHTAERAKRNIIRQKVLKFNYH